jgi:hypothetical protein
VVDAIKKEANDGRVAFGRRWFDSDNDEIARHLTLLTETLRCQTKYPCGEDGNGPCADAK